MVFWRLPKRTSTYVVLTAAAALDVVGSAVVTFGVVDFFVEDFFVVVDFFALDVVLAFVVVFGTAIVDVEPSELRTSTAPLDGAETAAVGVVVGVAAAA